MANKIDYTGKIVYMGIDVHKSKYVCACISENELIKRDSLPADPEGLLHYIAKFFSGAKIKSAYEAGFSGFHLHRYLIENGVISITSPHVFPDSKFSITHLRKSTPYAIFSTALLLLF